VFDISGERVAALPTPEQILGVDSFAGIAEPKLHRMHGIAEAARRGDLDVERIRGMEPEEAMQDVQRLDGIGPFYSALIVIRAVGLTDVLPENEPRALALAGPHRHCPLRRRPYGRACLRSCPGCGCCTSSGCASSTSLTPFINKGWSVRNNARRRISSPT